MIEEEENEKFLAEEELFEGAHVEAELFKKVLVDEVWFANTVQTKQV